MNLFRVSRKDKELLTKFPQVVEHVVRLKQLSEAMYKDDKAEAVREFRELLGSLSPELVMLFFTKYFFLCNVFSLRQRLAEQLSMIMEVSFATPS